jgi:hypothetical protein
MSLFLSLPAFLRAIFYRAILMNPHWMKRYIGTTLRLPSACSGKAAAGDQPAHLQSGSDSRGISEKPGVVDGRIEVREYLNRTISFDHDTVDGAPAARFTRQLVEFIESGYGLDELDSAPTPPVPGVSEQKA